MNRLNKTESAIFLSLMCFWLPKDLHSELILSSLQLMLCRVAAVERLPVHNHSADYIFSHFLIGLILSQFKRKSPLKPVLGGRGQYCTITLLHMNRLNDTEFAIFLSMTFSLLPKDLHSELIFHKLFTHTIYLLLSVVQSSTCFLHSFIFCHTYSEN